LTETLADLKLEFQRNRQKELELLRRVTGVYVPDYRVDAPESYYLKNLGRQIKR
jgi:hypothetical protein